MSAAPWQQGAYGYAAPQGVAPGAASGGYYNAYGYYDPSQQPQQSPPPSSGAPWQQPTDGSDQWVR